MTKNVFDRRIDNTPAKWRSEHVGTPAELVDMELFDPNSPKVQWANCCVHSVSLAYGLRNRQQFHSHPRYAELASRLQKLYGRGIPPHDLPKILRGQIPWPV
jgi:hypothetical protein